MTAKATTAADIAIGTHIRHYRTAAGWSQQQLARAIGVTFQQLQKYENGANRIAAARLLDVAAALRLPVELLLADPSEAGRFGRRATLAAVLSSPTGLRLAQAYERLADPGLRRQIVALIESIAQLERGGA